MVLPGRRSGQAGARQERQAFMQCVASA